MTLGLQLYNTKMYVPQSCSTDGHYRRDEGIDLGKRRLLNVQPICSDAIQRCVVQNDDAIGRFS